VYTVVIYGAGSIGNHLAYACRNKGWDVLMCDVDPEALKRTREDIYPSRYGRWDPSIRLFPLASIPREKFDLAIIGTPPDSHLRLAALALENDPPRVVLIEKPLCPPSLEGMQKLVDLQRSTGSFVAVGYNHVLTENSRRAGRILGGGTLGDPITISARFREHWGGIFGAHPWLSGPRDTYLGFCERGGGASGEHSHAINIWQHFAHLLGVGRIVEVSAAMDIVSDGVVNYDRICLMNVKTESGLVGDIAQDVVTAPSQKSLRIQGTRGFLEWIVNLDGSHDAVRYGDGKSAQQEEMIKKTRPDDFKGEIDHLEGILKGEDRAHSPLALERGLETMMVVAAAHISHRNKKPVKINYDRGYGVESLEVL
jgi:predicted dehydrogenase